MKTFALSVATILAMSACAIAGGDIEPVEPMVEVEAPAVNDSGFYLGIAYGAANYTGDYSKYYEEFGGQYWDEWSGTEEVDYDAIMLQAGYKINEYFAVEGRYWKSLGDGDYSDTWSGEDSSGLYNGTSSVALGDELQAWGLYAKPMYPVTEAVDVYALLGYGNVTLSDDNGDWLDENGFQWGIGASYAFTDNFSIFVDYVHMYSDESSYTDSGTYGIDPVIPWYEEGNIDHTIYTVNVGLSYKF